MSRIRVKIVYLITFFILLLFLSGRSVAIAQTDPEMIMTSTPNPVGSGARALGLGGAYIAIADDATAASWNPAALLEIKRPEISMVGSCFSGSREYGSGLIPGELDDFSHGQLRLNYFSAVLPLMLFRRNMVFSVNYQHLYEFSRDATYNGQDPALPDTFRISHQRQRGSLNTFSPAMAIQVVPPHDFYFGITLNLWLDKHLENHWESYNIIQREGSVNGEHIKTYAELYERYEFSGLDIFDFRSFNINLGILWRPKRWFSLGGVLKTPFKADIKMQHREISFTEHLDNPSLSEYRTPTDYLEGLRLEMPVSYGIGSSIRFSDEFSAALDIYRTHWEDYLIYYPSGKKLSPINNEEEALADIKPTTQIRLGLEYLAYNERVPLRAGIFYDPEPAGGHVDDFYGMSLGIGFIFEDFAFDAAYQYRFGEKRFHKFVENTDISANVRQHYLYASVIYFL